MGLAFNSTKEFTSTYFFGNNPATINIARTFGVELWERTFMYKLLMEEGVDDYAKWHSAYLWYANDVSLYGVPFFLLVLSFIFGHSYKEVFYSNDFISKLISVIIFNMLFYLFSNNTYLYHHFYSLTILLLIWFFTRFNRFV